MAIISYGRVHPARLWDYGLPAGNAAPLEKTNNALRSIDYL